MRSLFLLNETAAALVGTENLPDGVHLSIRHGNQKPGPLLGTVKDFHFQSMHDPIAPLAIEFDPKSYEYLLVKIRTEETANAIALIEKTWKRIAGNIPFDYSFLSQDYEALYENDSRTGQLFIVFAVIASVISLLGLFALASFNIAKRTKEIGVRKVVGASMTSIIKLLSVEFIYILGIAYIIAIPIGIYVMNIWLESFAYKSKPDVSLLIVAGAVNLFVAIVTLVYHGIRAWRSNAIDALRYE